MEGIICTGHSRAKETQDTQAFRDQQQERFLEGLREKFSDSRSWLLWVVLEAQRGPPDRNWSPGQMQVLLKVTVRTEQGEKPWCPLGNMVKSSL